MRDLFIVHNHSPEKIDNHPIVQVHNIIPVRIPMLLHPFVKIKIKNQQHFIEHVIIPHTNPSRNGPDLFI